MKEQKSPGSSGKLKLSRQKIFTSAFLLAQRRGIEAVSMRSVAKQLHVEAMSLYKHVENKDDLLDGVIEIIINQINLPSSDLHWKLALKQRALSEFKTLSEHSWVIHTLESRSGTGTTRLYHQNYMLGMLRKSGFSTELAFHTMIAVTGYVYGFVVFQHAWSQKPTEKTKLRSRVEQALDQEKHPFVIEAISYALNRKNSLKPEKFDDFEFGLDLIINGIEKLLSEKNK